jgi:hypothetical protein
VITLEPEEASMRAVVSRGIGDIRLEEVPDPQIEQPTDAIVRITRVPGWLKIKLAVAPGGSGQGPERAVHVARESWVTR